VTEGAEAWTGENPDWLDAGVEMQWSIAGAEATRDQLRDAGFAILEEWGATETLGDGSTGDDEPEGDAGFGDEDGSERDEDSGDEGGSENDDPWVFFSAQLDGELEGGRRDP